MDVSDFDFDLPDELIAQDPPAERGGSRLLVLSRESGQVEDARFADIGRYLRPGDLLIVNNTRVFPARLLGRRDPSGGEVECLLIEKLPTSNAQLPTPEGHEDGTEGRSEEWQALVHPGQKLKPGARVVFEGSGATLHGEVRARHFHGRRTVRLWTEDGSPIQEAIDRLGHIPLPPYIRRDDRPSDRERYQTVFARVPGAVAAPTAGLHFDARILDSLAARGVERTFLTLHVGAGTFAPVRTQRVEDHELHAEWLEVGAETCAAVERCRERGGRIVAVGTTSVRALETAARGGKVTPVSGDSRLYIYPGFEFRVVDAMVTNFHLPESSLLMLVCAFAGREQTLAAYRHAVAQRYRFFSYGDAMLVTPKART